LTHKRVDRKRQRKNPCRHTLSTVRKRTVGQRPSFPCRDVTPFLRRIALEPDRNVLSPAVHVPRRVVAMTARRVSRAIDRCMAREKEKSGELLNIIGRLNAATVEALKAQDMRDFLARYGAEPLGSTPEQMKRYFASETAKYARLVRASKAAAE
jgi:hypothetical protein